MKKANVLSFSLLWLFLLLFFKTDQVYGNTFEISLTNFTSNVVMVEKMYEMSTSAERTITYRQKSRIKTSGTGVSVHSAVLVPSNGTAGFSTGFIKTSTNMSVDISIRDVNIWPIYSDGTSASPGSYFDGSNSAFQCSEVLPNSWTVTSTHYDTVDSGASGTV